MQDTNTFSSPQMSLMTTILMMLSSIEYIDSWVNPYSDDDPNTLHFDTLSFLMLAVFILLMPILLMNLLVSHLLEELIEVFWEKIANRQETFCQLWTSAVQ